MALTPVSWRPPPELIEQVLRLFEERSPGLFEKIKQLEFEEVGIASVREEMLPLIKEIIPDGDAVMITNVFLAIRGRADKEVRQ